MMGFSVKVLAIVVALSGVLATARFDSDPRDAIEGEYIVVLHNTTHEQREHLVAQVVSLGGEILNVYTTVLSGFAARLGSVEEKILPFLLEHSLVEYVERNRMVKQTDDCITQQTSTPWGLSRISHVGSRAIDAFTYNPTEGGDGAGVAAYVIDTGIWLSHVEFAGRAEEGFNAFSADDDEPATDCNGHGTHVAGTIGGTRVGIAKAVTLISVKVLSCEGSGANSGVIAGIDYAVQDCAAGTRGTNLCVANLSLGGWKSEATNSAVDSAVAGGVVMVVAAGNEDTNACLKSPASAADAISVGATELNIPPPNQDGQGDERSSFSNYGPCVDIFAPGSAIESAWIDVDGYTENQVYATISGTSMASPHAAGVVAQHLANSGDATSPPASGYKAILEGSAETGSVDLKCENNAKCLESPNLFLQSLTC